MQQLLKKREVAEILRVSERTIDRERDSGRLKCVRVRGGIRFKMSEVEKYAADSSDRGRA